MNRTTTLEDQEKSRALAESLFDWDHREYTPNKKQKTFFIMVIMGLIVMAPFWILMAGLKSFANDMGEMIPTFGCCCDNKKR